MPTRGTAWPLGLAIVLYLGVRPAAADDLAPEDRMRVLYANRFVFSQDKLPLITVEIVSGLAETTLRATSPIVVRPDGTSGSSVEVAAATTWTISAEATQPAELLEWTVVGTFAPDASPALAEATQLWTKRGFEPRTFEVGTLFGAGKGIIDTREIRLAIAPTRLGLGAAKAAQLSKQFSMSTSVHQELIRRPMGTIVARAGTTVVRNPSVLWFWPSNPKETLVVADVPVGTGGSQLATSVEDRRYWGAVYVTLDHRGKLVVANAVNEDKLLAGIVPSEMFPSAPDAALEAQAIAARTELLQKIGRRNIADPFLLCSTQQCQVYGGAGKEDPRTSRAVEKTRGLVLFREGGGLLDVRYSAACGGHSEHNHTIWSGAPDPALRGHLDSATSREFSPITDANLDAFLRSDPSAYWCGKAKQSEGRFRWHRQLTEAELTARVAEAYPGLGAITAITPLARGTSGRVTRIKLVGKRSSVDVEGDLKIRRLLGGLKSTLFAVRIEGGGAQPVTFHFEGAGFGHGVGMCQMGAIGMAEAGLRVADILKHYYPGTYLERLY